MISLTALPSEMRKFISTARAGEMTMRFRNMERSTKLMYRLGQQFILAGIGIAGAATDT